ncbi:CKLF-like MARVEL transmembrane domain-containing protein 8 [Cricetulus griseus]|uniref:CKLF-like MARVEL transmembrane domain-containing protein 8 n=1 Tax=Cricetulus griseus TaxID=10029 RepID=A0A061I7P1_CRIGR|nr:CKLF-like MARVEL transmembrane domain-containing protein 8 [Cricetulus griseus]
MSGKMAQQGLCFNGSAFLLYLSAAVVDASSVSPEKDSHNFNSWAASSVSLWVPGKFPLPGKLVAVLQDHLYNPDRCICLTRPSPSVPSKGPAGCRLIPGGPQAWLWTAQVTRPVPSLAWPGHWAPEHQAAPASFQPATEDTPPLWALSTDTQVPRTALSTVERLLDPPA